MFSEHGWSIQLYLCRQLRLGPIHSSFTLQGFGFLTWVICTVSVTGQTPQALGRCALQTLLLPPSLSLIKKDKYGWLSSTTHHRKSNIMHSKAQSQRGFNQQRRSSAAVLCRLKSLLSRSGECLWLSLEESSQGWREAGRGWCRCGRGSGRRRRRRRRRTRRRRGGGAGLQGAQAFVFLSHLWRGGKGGETRKQSTAGALAGLWQRCGNQRCNVTRSNRPSSLPGLCGQAPRVWNKQWDVRLAPEGVLKEKEQ